MAASDAIVEDLLARHVPGQPLFTLGLTDAEVGAVADVLRVAVRERGLCVLASDLTMTRAFAIHAANFLATTADVLEWGPVLSSLGVASEELKNYAELYESIEAALGLLGRDVIVRRGRRRFLGTFLREGGLAEHIGDVAQLVASKVRLVGWTALLDEGVRQWVVDTVGSAASGTARSLFAAEEARFALAEFLLDVARTYLDLTQRGVDPTTLADPAAVEDALKIHGVEVPCVRNRSLLLAVLGSFRERPPPKPAVQPTARLLATERSGAVVLSVRADLALLDGVADLPPKLPVVTITASPSANPHRLVRRGNGGWLEPTSGRPTAEWVRSGARGATSLTARWSTMGGAVQVAPVAVLPAPMDTVLWFLADGEPIAGVPEEFGAGAQMIAVAMDPICMEAEGEVDLRELVAPNGAAAAYAIDVRGRGALRVGDTQVVPCGMARLAVEVLPSVPPPWNASRSVVGRLPDLRLPQGVAAELYASSEQGDALRLVASGLHGIVVPAVYRDLNHRSGYVRLALVAGEERRWSASWFVLPSRFAIETNGRELLVQHDAELSVFSDRPREIVAKGTRVRAAETDERCELLLRTRAGHTAKLSVPVARESLRLRRDMSFPETEVLEGATVSEREIYGGACLQLHAFDGSRIVVSKVTGQTILRATQCPGVRVQVPLTELVLRLRDEPSPIRLRATVQDSSGDTGHNFSLVIPRIAKPICRLGDGTVTFEVTVEAEDVPTKPAMALFPVQDPLAIPRIVDGMMSFVAKGAATLAVPDPDGSLRRGQHIVFFVDDSSPPRPMSGGARLFHKEASVPPPLDALGMALWEGQRRNIADELNRRAGTAELPQFMDRLVEAVERCSPYSLHWFFFFRTLATDCSWLLLATLPRLDSGRQRDWLQSWVEQFHEFSWTFFRAKDADRLARSLPALAPEAVMDIINVAKAAARMPLAVEYTMCEALFRGASTAPVLAGMRAEARAPTGAHLPNAWSLLALPTAARHQRWMTGVELDDRDLEALEGALSEQLCGGGRVRALRDLFRQQAESRRHQMPPLEVQWAAPTLARFSEDWQALSSYGDLARSISELERDILLAAAHTLLHLRGLVPLRRHILESVRAIEQDHAELFDFWFTALRLLPPLDMP